jgi:hypothetical protein
MLLALLAALLAAGSAAGEPPEQIDGAKLVGFKQLASFPFEPPERELTEPPPVPYPSDVLALEGQRIAVRGYLLPMDFDQSGISSFFLMARPDQGCCFGSGLAFNEWIDVHWKGKPLLRMDGSVPVIVIGTLSVRPHLEGGVVSSLYRMDGEKIEKAPE